MSVVTMEGVMVPLHCDVVVVTVPSPAIFSLWSSYNKSRCNTKKEYLENITTGMRRVHILAKDRGVAELLRQVVAWTKGTL